MTITIDQAFFQSLGWQTYLYVGLAVWYLIPAPMFLRYLNKNYAPPAYKSTAGETLVEWLLTPGIFVVTLLILILRKPLEWMGGK
jgi:hypothetical protein